MLNGLFEYNIVTAPEPISSIESPRKVLSRWRYFCPTLSQCSPNVSSGQTGSHAPSAAIGRPSLPGNGASAEPQTAMAEPNGSRPAMADSPAVRPFD